MTDSQDLSLRQLRGMGEKREQSLQAQGICDLLDLVERLPVGYVDTAHPIAVRELHEGQKAVVRLTLVTAPSLHRHGGRTWVKAAGEDETGRLPLLFFSMPWIRQKLIVGEEYLLYGRVTRQKTGLMMINPSFPGEAGITAEYTPVPGVAPKTYRDYLRQALELILPGLKETLPGSLLERYDLMPRPDALLAVHCPPDQEQMARARYRLAFEELLCYQAALREASRRPRGGVQIPVPAEAVQAFWDTLPFSPTDAQRRVLDEIVTDLRSKTAMARLVQGDVGCGKTAIAFGAMALCAAQGFQSALMAPTEVLAQQHYQNARRFLEPLGIRCGLLTGRMGQGPQREAHQALARGEWQVVVGTHALISQGVEYQNLGLVITDEQHRFGVSQRAALADKGALPNVLVLSATPIPRSLALVLYGDLSISVVDELPPGRTPVRTHLVSETKREGMLGFIDRQVASGAQAYFVCPLVEDSEAMEEIRSVESLSAELGEGSLSHLRMGVVHGRMKSEQKEEVLSAFREGELDLLISTTVIEVGVDVPNASVMVVEDAFRFGLSQLHQLRGRVGRGERESYCFLMSKPNPRLRVLIDSQDGFEIARQDLEQRGAGDFFGTRQHGQLLEGGNLRGMDAQLLQTTQQAVEALLHDPALRGEADQVFAYAKEWMGHRVGRLERS